jgi:hypothetical protein
MSPLFSLPYPRLGAIVIDWRCGTSLDPPLSLSLSLSLARARAIFDPLLAIETRYSLSGNPCASGTKACAPTHHHTRMTHTHTEMHGRVHVHTEPHRAEYARIV